MEEGRDVGPYEAFMYFATSLCVGALTLWFIDTYEIPIPYTIPVFAEGILFAVVDHVTDNKLSVLSRTLRLWEHINPELLLYGFLPILIFGDAMYLNVYLFKQKLMQCIMTATFQVLAGPGVVFSTGATGLFMYYLVPYDWSFWLCMTFGAISSATDPVAVVAVLKELGASPGLTMVITGESLFNDGTAMVLFYLCVSLARGHSKYASTMNIVQFFARMAFGGPAIGIGFGFLALCCLRITSRKFVEIDTTLQITITLVTAYLSYYIADATAGASGVLSCVFAGVVLAKYAHPFIQEPETIYAVWEVFAYIGNTIIFMLAGTLTGRAFCDNWYATGSNRGDAQNNWLGPVDVVIIIYVWAALVVIRGVMLGLFWPLIAYFEMQTPAGKRLGLGEYLMMTWGGLRGAVGLALAMVVEETFRDEAKPRWSRRGQQVLVLTAGGSFLTLLVNGWSSSALLSWLGMNKTDEWTKHLREYAETEVAHKMLIRFQKMSLDVETDENLVFKYVRLLNGTPSTIETTNSAPAAMIKRESARIKRETLKSAATQKRLRDQRSGASQGSTGTLLTEGDDAGGAGAAGGKEMGDDLEKTTQSDGFFFADVTPPSGSAPRSPPTAPKDALLVRAPSGHHHQKKRRASIQEIAEMAPKGGGGTKQGSMQVQVMGHLQQVHAKKQKEKNYLMTNPKRAKGLAKKAPSSAAAAAGAARVHVTTDGEAPPPEGQPPMHSQAAVSTADELKMLKTMRDIYLRMLKAEYWELLKDGFLPYGSKAALMLFSSVDFASDHVGEHLCDFDYICTGLDVMSHEGVVVPWRDALGFLDQVLWWVTEHMPQSEHGRQAMHERGTAALNTEMCYTHLAFVKAHKKVQRESDSLWGHMATYEDISARLPEIIRQETDAQLEAAGALVAHITPEFQREVNAKIIALSLLTVQNEEYVHMQRAGLISAKDRVFLVDKLIADSATLHAKASSKAVNAASVVHAKALWSKSRNNALWVIRLAGSAAVDKKNRVANVFDSAIASINSPNTSSLTSAPLSASASSSSSSSSSSSRPPPASDGDDANANADPSSTTVAVYDPPEPSSE